MKTVCPLCNHVHNVRKERLGENITCRVCKNDFTISEAVVCPECGANNSAYAAECHGCNTSLADDTGSDTANTSAQDFRYWTEFYLRAIFTFAALFVIGYGILFFFMGNLGSAGIICVVSGILTVLVIYLLCRNDSSVRCPECGFWSGCCCKNYGKPKRCPNCESYFLIKNIEINKLYMVKERNIHAKIINAANALVIIAITAVICHPAIIEKAKELQISNLKKEEEQEKSREEEKQRESAQLESLALGAVNNVVRQVDENLHAGEEKGVSKTSTSALAVCTCDAGGPINVTVSISVRERKSEHYINTEVEASISWEQAEQIKNDIDMFRRLRDKAGKLLPASQCTFIDGLQSGNDGSKTATAVYKKGDKEIKRKIKISADEKVSFVE